MPSKFWVYVASAEILVGEKVTVLASASAVKVDLQKFL